MDKIRPLQDRVIVKRVKEEEKTKGGLFIPDTAKEKPVEGKVVAEAQFTQALGAVADKESDLGKRLKYNLGIVSEKKKNKEAALRWYQEIMATDIGYLDVSERVARLMNGDA